MSDPSSPPTQPLTEAEPYEDTFMVSHQQTALGEHELDKIRAYFKEQIRPGGDLSDPDGTMARIWMGRLLADAGLSRQMLARAEAEAERLRTKYASLQKVHEIINDAHEYKSIKVYELTDQLDAMEPKFKAVQEFATSEPEQTGHCGSPSHTHWCHRHAHMEAREQVSRALGLDQDGRGQADA